VARVRDAGFFMLGVFTVAFTVIAVFYVAREWARILETQLAAVTNGLAESIRSLQEIAIAEEKLPIEFGPPAVDKPSHELLGEALLAANRPREALAAFEKSLARAPERTASLAGVMQAAEKLGDAKRAGEVRAKLQGMSK